MPGVKSYSLCIALAVAVYLFFSLTFLQLPGLYFDETIFVNAAMGFERAPFIAWSADIFGKKVPMMIMEYIGALKSALYAPIFKFFGGSAVTARLPVICFGLITLLTAWALFRRVFDLRISTIALILFASDPTFIFANKLDWGPVSLMLLLEMSSLYFMWRWMTEGRRRHLMIGGFLLGLGLYNKIIFAWFLVAFAIAVFLCFRESFFKLLRWRQLTRFLPAFLLGCSPLIAFNICVPMGTFQFQKAADSPGRDILISRYHLFRTTLDGSGVYYFINGSEVGDPSDILKAPPEPTLRDRAISALAGISWVRRSTLPFALLVSLALILLLWIPGRLRKKREILFMGCLLVAMALMICLSAGASGAHHAIALYPFVFIVIAYAIGELGQLVGKSPVIDRILVGICLIPLLAPQLVIDARYLKSFQAKGGVRFWSDAIYGLASFARENQDKHFLFMEWGFSTQLVLLTNGRIRYEDLSCDQADTESCVESALAQSNSYFVFHVPPFENKPLMDTFKRTLAGRNLQGRIIRTFFQRDGRPVYVVYEIVNPLFQAQAKKGEFYYLREAENFDSKSGGSLDSKDTASNKMALGNFWGQQQDDFASYKFQLSRDIGDVYLYLRYAFEDPNPQSYFLLLDGNFAAAFTLPSTKGYGYTTEQWNTSEIRLGDFSQGPHEITIKPARNGQTVNMDYWYLTEGRFKPKTASVP
ncbi:MAG: glycosyltransferase family 39 protein [Acidobacteria bacterium]|nr:glycosyltransferase family 39 protein [Acidobacteriota bacterium]